MQHAEHILWMCACWYTNCASEHAAATGYLGADDGVEVVEVLVCGAWLCRVHILIDRRLHAHDACVRSQVEDLVS